MATVLIEFQIKVVDDELMKKLSEKTLKEGDLAEIPELPGVCWNNVKGVSSGNELLSLMGLANMINTATFGVTPTKIMFIRKGDPVRIRTS